MIRTTVIVGFILLIALDTYLQIAFKLASQATLPMTFDIEWLRRVIRSPWTHSILIGYVFAFLIYMTILKHAPVGPAFAASHAEIVIVTIIGVLYFGESITWVQAGGCALIVAGIGVLAATESA